MDDPRLAALERLAHSRKRFGAALAPAAPGSFGAAAGWRRLRRMSQALLMGSGWGHAGQLADERVLPWVRRHPGWAMGLGAVAGAGLFLARGWLMAAARLQALRWWRTGQALLVQQSLDPAWLQQLLAALPAHQPAAAEPAPTSAEPSRTAAQAETLG